MKKLFLFSVLFAITLISCKPEIEKPTVVTKFVGDVTKTTANIVGQVTADGGADVTERGVCWNTEGNPQIIDFRTKDGSDIGTFTSYLSNLQPQTTYYVRAYATNEAGTSYGEEKNFTTEKEIVDTDELPSVTTSYIIDITSNTAKCGGCVISDGGLNVINRGVCWSTSRYPTIEDDYENAGNGIGEYKCELEALEPNTTYYVRAYATNAKGTAYGEEKSFTTLEPENMINGHEYVDLGLPSGLKWATCNVGAFNPELYGDYYAWGETKKKSYYNYDNSETYCYDISDISGNIKYDVARKVWGGTWRIPTKVEMEELIYNCSWRMIEINGISGAQITGPNGNQIFLPTAGYRHEYSLYESGDLGVYWTSKPHNINDYEYNAYALEFYTDDDFDIDISKCVRYIGLSIRPVSE